MSLILAMCGFALAMSASPGPINIMTLSSGLTHGVTKTVPFVFGATVAFTALLFLTGIGILQAVTAYPALMEVLKYAGAGYILYLAYRIAFSGDGVSAEKGKHLSFLDGALLQWLNPKAWLACLSGVAAFVAQGEIATLILFCSLYFVICFGGVGIWAVIGAQSQQIITTPARVRLFNRVMGIALALTALYLLVTG